MTSFNFVMASDRWGLNLGVNLMERSEYKRFTFNVLEAEET